ncbi:MerR family transcriptional regulator [bacterium]|nr:MerR family transcriptional regulator [bacterium]
MVRLEELAQWGQQLMDRLGWHEGDSKRVTWTPTPRLLRYYTTLGLLDRAAHFQGRTAFYTGKHLLQVLAIKHLQLAGSKLEDIQRLLLGKSEQSLAEMLGLSLPLPDPQVPSQEVAPLKRRSDFWEELPERALPAPTLPVAPRRHLQSLEPLSGLQVLIDSDRLPDGFKLEEFLQKMSDLVREMNEGGSKP